VSRGAAQAGRLATDPLNVGGQAVIEGVMMRAPGAVSTAVRRPDGTIAVQTKPLRTLASRFSILRLPILRGAVGLVEALYIGVGSLMYSAEAAMEEEPPAGSVAGSAAVPLPAAAEGTGAAPARDWKTSLFLGGTVAFSLLLGVAVFFYLPLVLTERLGIRGSITFNLVDGAFRLVFFLVYIWGITRWKEMQRVFEYHGAEHKSIFAYEAGLPLTVENARRMVRFHPRCGTSFLLIVMLSSIFVFAFLGRPDTVGERLLRLAFVPVIGGLSYEAIRFSGRHASKRWVAVLVAPGLALQRLTTREPDDSQLEVALAALHEALGLAPQEAPAALAASARIS
jgi:uncharacterized protein YqhQ